MPARCRMLFAALVVAAVPGSVSAADLVLILKIGPYWGHTYAVPPASGAYVAIAGEPLRLEVGVANWGADERHVEIPAAPFAFRVRREGSVVAAGLTSNGPRLVYDSGEVDLTVGQTARIPRRTWITWDLSLDTAGLTPGTYTAEVATPMLDERGKAVSAYAPQVTIEVRSREAERIEWLRRRALQAQDDGDAVAATESANALIRAYPDGFAGYVLLAELAEESGNAALARRQYGLAVAAVASGRDRLYLRGERPPQVKELIDALSRRAKQ